MLDFKCTLRGRLCILCDVYYDVTPKDTCFLLGPVWGCDRLVSRAKVIENQVMAAPIISISSDLFEECVGSHAPRVILFGVIPAIIPIIPKVLIVLADPIVAPEPAEQRPVSSSHDTLAPLSEFPLAPVVSPPGIHRRPAIFVRPGEAIPFGRLYRTHLNRPRKFLTARKRVRPIPARRFAWRRVSHHSSDRHSSPDSSSSSSPSDSIFSGYTPPEDTLLIHLHHRDLFRSLARTPPTFVRLFRRWESAPLSNLYPLDYIEERASLVERIGSLRLEYLKVRAMLSIERDRIDSICWHMTLSQEEFHQVRRDRDDTRRRRRRLESTITITRSGMTPEAIEELVNRRVEEALAAHEATHGKNGNGENGNGGNRNPNENGRGDRPVSRECTYQDFMKCQPLNFKGTEGVVGLIRWFEKMETVFHISNCPEKYQVKYATCTLLNSALTWWNSHKRTIGTEAAFAMSWRELMKLMTEVYCPRNKIQKMETELWNLTVKNNDLAAYTQIQELTMILPDNIQGNVIAAEPTKLQDAVRIANNLMDQKLKGYAVKNAKNKRRLEVNQRDNH
ncbi:reverse transcriptase domain-containing protein, partial [Tanacetum coccineum]